VLKPCLAWDSRVATERGLICFRGRYCRARDRKPIVTPGFVCPIMTRWERSCAKRPWQTRSCAFCVRAITVSTTPMRHENSACADDETVFIIRTALTQHGPSGPVMNDRSRTSLLYVCIMAVEVIARGRVEKIKTERMAGTTMRNNAKPCGHDDGVACGRTKTDREVFRQARLVHASRRIRFFCFVF